jgi:hypothetical protein
MKGATNPHGVLSTINDEAIMWLEYIVGPENKPFKRKPATSPHCECVKARRRAGQKVRKDSKDASVGRSPVVTSCRDGVHCDHCGYVAVWLDAAETTRVRESQRRKSTAQLGVKRGKYRADNRQHRKPVRGLDPTGRVVHTFPSITAARDAGFTNVAVALSRRQRRHGLRWEYV